MSKDKSKSDPASETQHYFENTGLNKIIQKMINSLAAERDPDPVIYMIRYLAFLRTKEQLARHGIVFTGEFPQKRPLLWFPEFKEEWKSLLKEWLNEGLWRELKKCETKFKGYIQHWVQLGVYDQNDEVGVFATDEDAYTKFDRLFMPIVCKIHKGYDGEADFNSNMDLKVLKQFSKLEEFKNQFSKLEEFKNKISLIRISARRNFKDYAFTPLIGAKDKNEIKAKIEQKITDFKCEYHQLDKIDDMTKSWLESFGIDINRNKSHDSAGINEDWPSGRGVIIDDNKAFVILVNFEDHIQVFTISEDGNFRNNLKDLIKILSKFNEIGYAKHNSLGFLTASPKNLGTAMKFYVWIKLKEYKIDQIDEKKYSWKINNIDKKEGIYEVTYNKTLDKGLTENKAISQFLACLLKLTENEKTDEEEKQIEIVKQQAKAKNNKKNDKIDPQILVQNQPWYIPKGDIDQKPIGIAVFDHKNDKNIDKPDLDVIIEQRNNELNPGQIPYEINNAIIDQFYPKEYKDEEQILKNDETNSNNVYEDDGTDQNTLNEMQETENIEQPLTTHEDKEVYNRDCEDASIDQNTEIKIQKTENIEQPSAIQNDMEESSLVCENTSVNQNTEIIEQKIDSKESVSSTQNKEEETNEIQEENDINSKNVGKDMQEIHHEETKDSNEPVNMSADEIENEQIESKI